MAESVMERLQQTNPDAEIWWDSSPLIFDWWAKKNVDAAAAGQKKDLEAQLKRLFVWDDMGKSVFRGCTTNPPLSLTAAIASSQRAGLPMRMAVAMVSGFWMGWPWIRGAAPAA